MAKMEFFFNQDILQSCNDTGKESPPLERFEYGISAFHGIPFVYDLLKFPQES